MTTHAHARRQRSSRPAIRWRGSLGIATLAICAAASLFAAGCARAHAKAPAEAPPLSVPAAPPHDVEPVDTTAPPEIQIPKEPPRRAPIRPTPPAARPERPESSAPRTESKPEQEPPKPAEEQPRPPTTPPTTLQTTPPAAEGEVERGIRALLARANDDLSKIDYRVLNPDARTQYDTAKRFIRQAEDAIRARNLVFARNLADKAAGLAAQLSSR